MKDFTYYNPVKVVFGANAIERLADLVPPQAKVLLVTGTGSIRTNGVYDRVMKGLSGRKVVEYSGIEPNPEYEKCMEAVMRVRESGATFLLSVGGGSVLDATKFIAVAAPWKKGDPWDIVEKSAPVEDALPIGCVLTLPATGSEVNGNSVISRRAKGQKLAFSTPMVMPVFSLLDPATTLSLSWRQTANGIVDAFVHVMEQYLTYDVDTRLQDRQAEAILSTLIEVAPRLKADPADLNARATLMWAASNALNNLINCGTVQDWSTHVIGHELTALHGLDHAQTLAIVLPAVMRHQKAQKGQKIAQFGQRVLGISGATQDEIVERTIAATAAFFEEVGIPTRLGSWGLTVEQCLPAAAAIGGRDGHIGEHQDIGENEVAAILHLCA